LDGTWADRKKLSILQISMADKAGGAEKVAFSLFDLYRKKGYASLLAVGRRKGLDPDVMVIDNDRFRNVWARACINMGRKVTRQEGESRFIRLLRRALVYPLGQPWRCIEIGKGHEDLDFPATWRLLDACEPRPDIVHCHNLHGGYFDLRVLPWLSARIPVVLTLHDAWLLGGHCAHSFDCVLWQTGCRRCDYLGVTPSIRRDGASFNWRRKSEIFTKSRIFVATPSRWLMEKVEKSIIAKAVINSRVIPNGVDLSIFRPGDKKEARTLLNLPINGKIVLFVANGIRDNPWKDYPMLKEAMAVMSVQALKEEVRFIGLGDEGGEERLGDHLSIQFVSTGLDEAIVARFYQAADIYVHPSRIDTFPTTILEAMACGLPTVATSVGGIPEQIYDGLTGFLVAPGDAGEMAQHIIDLIDNDELRLQMGEASLKHARDFYDARVQAKTYLDWYSEILAKVSGTNAEKRLSERKLAIH
jgi:glycosyltransferase involved in cell wall biosynthesis